MFDFHMHTTVSFDGHDTAPRMVQAAEEKGLKEICFTDHIDYVLDAVEQRMIFDTEVYNAAYDNLTSDKVKIRRGLEFGLRPENKETFRKDLQRRHFDFVLGSVHFVREFDVYAPPYWQDKTILEAERRYFEETLACVRAHEDFDVLAHLTYISKCRAHPDPRPVNYDDHREVLDEILLTLARKGKGMEMNTSGVDRCGNFLPYDVFFRRFKELGGEIVTVGSDAHTHDRVGQYTDRACAILKDIFGYVCTFEDRKPIFHKL